MPWRGDVAIRATPGRAAACGSLVRCAAWLRVGQMDVGAQRRGGEVLFPAPPDELFDVLGRVAVDALEDIDEVVVGFDGVQTAGDQQALDGGDGLGADLAPAEQPVLAAQGDRAQGAFQMVGIGHVGVADVDAQGRASLQCVVQRLGERVARQERSIAGGGLGPVEEGGTSQSPASCARRARSVTATARGCAARSARSRSPWAAPVDVLNDGLYCPGLTHGGKNAA